MKPLLRVIFEPISNRYHTNKKTSVVNAAIEYIPFIIICSCAALFINNFFWFVLLFGLLWGVLSYLLFDKMGDKLRWNLYLKKFYKK